ncbi:MAG: TraC family protein, partial [Pseudomonadota bacterium]
MVGFNDALNGSILSPVLAFDPVAETFYCADKMIGFGFECQPLPGVRLEDADKIGALLEEDWPNGAFLSVLLFASTNVVLRLGDCLRQREGSGRDDDVDFTHRSLAWFDERARRGFDEISGQRLRNWKLLLTVKFPIASARPTEVELERIEHLKRRLSSALTTLELQPRTLNAESWLTVSAEMANQQDGSSWQRYGVRRHEPSVPLNEQVIDSGSKIMIERDHLALHGNKKLMILSPTAFPEPGFFGMASNYFSDLNRGRKGVTRPAFAVLNVWFGDQGGERSKMQSRAVMAKHTAGGSIVKWFPNIAEQAHCFAELQRSSDAGHAIVRCQLAFGVYADSEEDREPALSEVIGHFSQRGWTVAPDRFITAPLFITALP